MYEPPLTPPLPLRKLLRRLVNPFAIGAGVLLFSLLVGMAGYVYFEGLTWLDAFLNAAMLLGGWDPCTCRKPPAASSSPACMRSMPA